MHVGVLGPLEVVEDGKPILVNGTRTRTLLGVLALHAGAIVSSERLVDELWGGQAPRNAANALQARVSQLRRLIGGTRLVSRPPGYLLDVARDDVDATRFEDLGGRGRAALGRGEVDEAASILSHALAMWRGPALIDLSGGDLVAAEAARLEELHLALVEDRIEADLALGHHIEVSHELRGLVREHPMRERLWGQLMVALYRSERQADALAAFQQARAVLAEELGLDPGPELQRLEAAILTHDRALDLVPTRVVSTPRTPEAAGNLRPSLTSFVGREEDRRRVRKLLDEGRLITLTGPGGTGKTRLVEEVGADVACSIPHGVWLVELAGVADPGAVTSTVASALGVRDSTVIPLADIGGSAPTLPPLQRLLEHLDGARLLLILDNCEHLLAEVASLTEVLLGACPGLRVLATSREPLGVAGEVQWPVAPLPVPTVDVEEPEDLVLSASVRLFTDRAAAVVPSFSLTSENAPMVAEICRRLDGLPLAIELAAAKVKSLPLGDIVARLDDRFRLLGTGTRRGAPRQQTLRALVDWSYDLLAADERIVFEALSCFAGGATLAAAEQVCVTGPVGAGDVVDILARLVDKSLVVADLDHPVEPRYEFLETLRQYGREKLEAAGLAGEIELRHARHFLALAQAGSVGIRGGGQRQWLARLDVEHDNLRAALDWTVAHQEVDLALGLARALGWFWYLHGPRQEARDRLDAVLRLPVATPTARAGVIGWVGFLAFCDFDLPLASASCEENLRLSLQVGEPAAIALAQGLAALVQIHLGAVDHAATLLDEAIATFVDLDDEWGLASARFVAAVLAVTHDVERGEWLAEDALRRFRAMGDGWGVLHCLSALGQVAEVRGEYEAAAGFLAEAVTVGLDLGLADEVANLQAQLGNLAVLRGERDRDEWLRTEAATPSRRFGLAWVAYFQDRLGVSSRRHGDLARARRLHEHALAIYHELGVAEGAGLARARLGALAQLTGDLHQARVHYAECLKLMTGLGHQAAVVQAVLGDDAFAALAMEQRRTLTCDEAIALALAT